MQIGDTRHKSHSQVGQHVRKVFGQALLTWGPSRYLVCLVINNFVALAVGARTEVGYGFRASRSELHAKGQLVNMMNALLCATAVFSAPAPLNVLLIAVDDLRTEISPYPEGAHMHTPNLERLAARSVVFERAYVQVAVCMPSRTALLTSRRPDTSRSWTIEPDQYWRKSGGNFSTLR